MTFLKNPGQLCCRMSLTFILLPGDQTEVKRSSRSSTQWGCVIFSESHQETHDEICPIIEDLKCYHLVKPVTGFLHFKAISYSLELIRDVRSDILLPHDHMFPTDDWSIHWWFLPQPIFTMMLVNWLFSYFYHFFYFY